MRNQVSKFSNEIGARNPSFTPQPYALMDSLVHCPVICCRAMPPPHWVPDSQLQQCSSCGEAFNAFTRRHVRALSFNSIHHGQTHIVGPWPQHCRCCGGIYCDGCSSGRTSLPGFGYLTSVRVCDDCRKFETTQLPLLLAGDLWVKVGERTGARHGSRHDHLLRLSADQTNIIWTRWKCCIPAEPPLDPPPSHFVRHCWSD